MNYKDGFKKGTVEMLLLKILSEGDCYGYQISQTIKRLSDGIITIPEGSMYPTLYKLQDKGYISDYKMKVGKRMERVYYHLEKEGRDELDKLVSAYYEVSEATKAVLAYKSQENVLSDVN